MARDRILVIDQGTTSTRAVLYDTRLQPVGQGQREVPPTYPKQGWVEHDPKAIIDSIGATVTQALADASIGPDRVAAIGLTNQRETTLLWDRATGEAIGPAIVWQDRRTADLCRQLSGRADWIAERTGLLIDSYFSATKLSWMLDHLPDARARAEAGDLAFGTVDSLVLRHLTGGRLHATDVTNASRTLLMDLREARWADDLCEYFGIPSSILPEIVPSSGEIGQTRGLGYLPDGLPIAGIAGDQQASLFGNGCFRVGEAKCTYGTGAFLLVNTGEEVVRSTAGLVTTPAATPPGQPQQYALEGSVFIAGAAVQWFRDGLKAIGAAPEINPISEDADPDSELLFVPALTGLGAPHWQPEARGTIFGITRGTTVPDLARAVIEGVAYQIADLVEAMNADLPTPLASLRADGGMARSDPFLKFQADLMGLPIHRSPQTEATALGAAALAALGVGLLTDLDAIGDLLESGGDDFQPEHDVFWRRKAMKRWRHAVETVVRHYRTR
jgi:glycerol kinase